MKNVTFLALLASFAVTAAADEVTPAPAPPLAIQRTSCTNKNISVNAKTNKSTTTNSTSLQTSASWTVRGYSYSLVYYFNKATENTPAPVFAQLQSSDMPFDGGTISSTQSRIVMVTEHTGKVEDFSFEKQTYGKPNDDGTGQLWNWVNGAKADQLTDSTKQTNSDGSVRITTTSTDQKVYNGFRDGGSTSDCTVRSLSREAWLVLVDDPAAATAISNLDDLAAATAQAEQSQSADLDAKEKAFMDAWNGLYAERKADFTKKFAAIRKKRDQERRSSNGSTNGSGYLSSGEIAAMEAVESAKRQFHRNEVERELQDIQDALNKDRHP